MSDKIKDGTFYYSNYYAFFVLGLYVLMIGTILPYILKEVDLSLTSGGMLLASQAVGNLLGGIFLTILSDRTGSKPILVMSPLLITIGYSLVITANPYLMYPGFFLSGTGWGGINNLVNLTVSDKSNGNQVILGRTHMFFALGALTSPLLTAFAVSAGFSWRIPAVAVIFMSALSAVIYIFIKLPGSKEKSAANTTSGPVLKYIAKNKIFLVFMGLLFFYVGFESSINGWVVTYFIDTGRLNDNTAQAALSVFWITCTLGRLVVPSLFRMKSESFILVFFSVSSVLSFILMLIVPSPFYIILSMALLGFSLACFYPVIISGASRYITTSGKLAAVLMCCGALGASILPMISGRISDAFGILSGMATAGISIVLVLVLSLNLKKTAKILKLSEN